jgi:hypothetical protein
MQRSEAQRPRESDYAPPVISDRRGAVLMGAVAATLAVMSLVHLSGILGGSEKPFDRSDAGIAEAVICVVLGYGATALLRRGSRARPVALAATGFAIVGFLVGLRFTLAGGGAIEIAYHLGALPILLLTLTGLARSRVRGTRGARART